MLPEKYRTLKKNRDIWLREGYEAASPRILILGESVYGNDPPRLDTYIDQWILENKADTTISSIFNACSGKRRESATVRERQDFWQDIAFYNFVERTVGPTSKHRPTDEDFRNAIPSLNEVLSCIEPNGVFILGKEQAKYSEEVVRNKGIPYVVAIHPTGHKPEGHLKEEWMKLKRLASNAAR